MKNNGRIKIMIVLLLLLIAIIGLGIIMNQNNKMLSMSVVDETVSRKGKDNITWSDFEKYPHNDIGSGIYIYEYLMQNGYKLYIGGASIDELPQYIYIIDKSGNKTDIINRLL